MGHIHESIKSWLHLRTAYRDGCFITWALKCALTIFLSIKAETCQTSRSLVTVQQEPFVCLVFVFSTVVAYANASVLYVLDVGEG